jgi:hypothetical protein
MVWYGMGFSNTIPYHGPAYSLASIKVLFTRNRVLSIYRLIIVKGVLLYKRQGL